MNPLEYPTDGILDLHVFQPSEASSVVREYLRVCREKQVLEVRIIHGKGSGRLRETVHRTLEKIDYVQHYRLAGDKSGWGATLVTLEP